MGAALANLAMTAGSAVAGSIANQIGYGIGELTGYNKAVAEDQIEQQQKLTDIQSEANLGLMKESYKEQKNLWDSTQAEAQVAHLKAAGLNPAIIYAHGGAGGSTSGGGGTSVSGSQASDESSRKQAQNAQTATGLALMKMQSEIEVNKSIAEANKAKAVADTANAKTTEASRDYLVEKLRQEGKGNWIDNLRKAWENQSHVENESITYKNKNVDYGTISIDSSSLFNEERTNSVLRIKAEEKNLLASELLTNEKAKGYFTELLNDTARANAAGIEANAHKLAAEFQSGELMNVKQWIELAKGIMTSLVGAGFLLK